MRLYEGMFVIDSSVAERDYDGVCKEVESTISKHGGSVVDLRKWDERRLAYELERARRGVYILVHFEAPPESIAGLRRDFDLSDNILRQLLLVDSDGVPSGDERPGITTSISEASHRRRGRSRRSTARGEDEKKGRKEEKAEESPDEESDEDKGRSEDEDAGDEEKKEGGEEKQAEESAAVESDEGKPDRKEDSQEEDAGGEDVKREEGAVESDEGEDGAGSEEAEDEEERENQDDTAEEEDDSGKEQ